MLKKIKHCNVCLGNFKSFISITDSLGGQLKEKGFPHDINDFETLEHKQYSCPNCGGSDRDRLIQAYINTNYHKKDKVRILEFAPSMVLKKSIQATTGTKSYKTADLYMKDVDDKVDICDMKKTYKDSSFDLVICSHVLEHVEDDVKAMQEIRRITSPKGEAIILVPIIDADVFDEDIKERNGDERWRRFAQDDHLRLYSKKKFTQRLKKAGMTVKELGIKELGIKKYSKLGISKGSILYICTKDL